MRKLILTLTAAFCFLLSASAQNRTVTGRVTNDKDAPLEGVNIATPDGQRATQTDKEGKFSLSVPSSINTLVFSYINFETTTKSIGKNNTVSISLKPSDSKLEEVVVVGYGTQKRREVTGSVSTIKGQAVANKPVQSFEQALAGRAAGVQITVPSGVLNSPPVFRIRGTNTISLSSYPLVIVDGVPVPTGDFSSTNAAGNALASINPNDIESIDIAKDAAAASIYGSRAANGVVFITTKKGKPGKAKVAYNGSFGFTNVFGVPEVLNAQQYTDYKNMALANNQNINSTNPAPNTNYYHFATAIGPDGKMIDTKWADVVYRQGFSQEHNLNVSGASEFTSYYLSAGYSKQEGILKANDFARKNILANIDSKLSKYITVGGKLSYSDEFNLAATTSGSLSGEAFNTGGLGRIVMVNAPSISPFLNSGAYNLSTGGNFIGSMNNIINGSATASQVGFYNPSIIIDKNRSNSETNHIQSNMYIQVKPISWLTLRSIYGIDYLLVDNDIFQTGLHGDGFASNGNTSSTYGKYKRYTWSNTAQFDYSVKGVHNISALVGQEQDRRTSLGFGVNRQQVSDPVYTVIQAGWGINNSAGSVLGENYLLSGFGRLNYDYKKRYFVSGNLRQDEYSALPGQKEIFWGVSAGWDVAKEKFFSNLDFFSSLKLRASFGKVGNTAGIGDFATYSTYGSGLYGGNPTLVFNQAGNSNLKWETSNKSDFGTSFGFFRDRLTFDVTYYKNDVSNLILNVPQSPSAGLPTTIPQNVGKMYNKGVELTINAVPVTNKNFTWSTNFNFSANKNEVTELAPGLTEVLTASSGLETINRTTPGYSVGSAWLVRSGGVDPATGSRVLLNAAGKKVLYRFAPNASLGQFQWSNEDGTRYNKPDGSANTINQAADAVMYNVIPKYVGGFSNNFKYKSFELDVLMTYQLGFYVYYGSNAGLHDQRFWNNHIDVLTAWKNPGDITTVPRPVYGDNVSNGSGLPMDYNLFKGDFVKLKNLTFAYNLPSSLLSKLKVSSARFFISGQNLAIITKYPGPDPEVSSNGNSASSAGVDRNTIANGRTLTAGVNIGF